MHHNPCLYPAEVFLICIVVYSTTLPMYLLAALQLQFLSTISAFSINKFLITLSKTLAEDREQRTWKQLSASFPWDSAIPIAICFSLIMFVLLTMLSLIWCHE